MLEKESFRAVARPYEIGMGLEGLNRRRLALRRAKVAALQVRRLAAWVTRPDDFARPQLASLEHGFTHLAYAVATRIDRTDPDAHPLLEEGKRINLALAAPHFDGLLLTPEHPLSFWRALGRVTAAAGYRHGMELRGGCIVPALGGGLCLLSNALFVMAATLGWTILERHGHSREAIPPDPDALWGLDATVAWPYVDLRVAPRAGRAKLGARVADGHLHLTVHTDQPSEDRFTLHAVDERILVRGDVRIRQNRILRRRSDASGAQVEEEIIARNRKELLHREVRRRNCLTCNVTSCHARVDVPGVRRR